MQGFSSMLHGDCSQIGSDPVKADTGLPRQTSEGNWKTTAAASPRLLDS
jgi:hypothetical protein